MGLGSCETAQIECFRASTTIVSEDRDVKDFNGVIFNDVGDLIVSEGPTYSVNLEGPENVVELTQTTLENGLLVISTSSCFNGDYDFVIRVTAPNLEYLALAGIGKIETVGNIEGNYLQVDIFGIGQIEANIFVDTLRTTVSGTAEIDYGGIIDHHSFNSSGDFTMNAFPLETESTTLSFSGTGESFITAYQKLVVRLQGTGNVYYQGNPEIESEITGEGNIIDSN